MARIVTAALVSSVLLASVKIQAADVQLSYYWDNRDYNTASLQISSNDLPQGFSVWGFTDLHSAQDDNDERYDASRSFSEYRLSNSRIGQWAGIEQLGLQVEYNEITPGSDNHVTRAGLTFTYTVGNHWLQLRLFLWQSREEGQASLAFRFPLTDKFSLTGFADYNWHSRSDDQWVIEPQLNYQLSQQTDLLLEFRYNGYEDDNPALDGGGVAIGVRYRLP